MPTKQQNKQPANAEEKGGQDRNAVIANHVLRALGQPAHLLAVRVRPLWGDRYRVNIVVGVDFASAKVANSYFLVVDGEGAIVTSTPVITRQY
jgi:hypothetical protein